MMFLTRKRQCPRDPAEFPAAQLFLLAIVRVAEPIALTSIYPYAWKLVLRFHVGDPSNASFYAGLLISAFCLAEALTGMLWGGLSDRYGRKPILLFGCAGTILSLLVVGFSTNFWLALLGRALGGLLNGNVGVIQTMVGELVTLPAHEPKAYAVMPFVWSIGTILGPAIGGCLAEPSENFPSMFSSHGVFAKYPYLLPNLVCALLLLAAIILGLLLIEETHPDLQPWSTQEDYDNTTAETPLMATAGATEHAPTDLRNESYGTFNAVDAPQAQEWVVRSDGRRASASAGAVAQTSAFTRRVVMLTVALGIFTYHSMTYDHLLPIFLQDDRAGDELSIASMPAALGGGLGLSIQQVGVIMSFNGIIALFVQAVIFPAVASWLGVWKTLMAVTLGHPIAYFIVPYLTLLPAGWIYPGIYTCLFIRNLFSILAYPALLILIKEASPSASHLGKINGLAASTGAACRTVAGPIAGFLYGVGSQISFTALPWWSSAGVALAGVVQVFFIQRRKKSERAQVRTLRYLVSKEDMSFARKDDIVRIYLDDADSEGESDVEYSDSDHEETPLNGRF